MENKVWSKNINEEIDSNLSGSNEKDLRFFRVAEFKRNINRVGEFSDGCGFCSKQKIDIKEAVENIKEAINVPGENRKTYDRLISRLSKHMRKQHGFFPPFYYSYLFSFYGIVAGIFLGYLLYLFVPANSDAMFIAGFSVCLIVGYIIGSQKDSKIRLEKRLM